MATPLSPSKIVSDNQIEKLKTQFGDALRKVNPFSEDAQDLIETSWDELRDEVTQGCVGAINRVLERKRNTIPILAKRVDYTRTPMQVIKATGRVEYVDEDIAKTMPRLGEGVRENMEVVFFKLGRNVGAEELDREYELRGLVPDPYAQAAVNEQDSAFADKHPNGSQWYREGRNASYLAFDRWSDDERRVDCLRRGNAWLGHWWFAGVRKS